MDVSTPKASKIMSSNPHSQIAIEQQWLLRQADAEPPAVEPGDWVLSLGDDWAFLHPGEGSWYFFDSIHADWAPSGIAVGEAILLTAGGVTGAKRLPADDDAETSTEQKINRLSDWCFLLKGEELLGPLQQADIPEEADEETRYWSPRFSHWLTLEEFRTGEVKSSEPKSSAHEAAQPHEESQDRFCTQCGSRTFPGDRFCRGCGAAVVR